jgi:hypothetical protein
MDLLHTQSLRMLPSFSILLVSSTLGHLESTAKRLSGMLVPATAFFWRGYLPPTPARYSICIDCVSEDVGKVATLDVTAANPSSGPVSPLLLRGILNSMMN